MLAVLHTATPWWFKHIQASRISCKTVQKLNVRFDLEVGLHMTGITSTYPRLHFYDETDALK